MMKMINSTSMTSISGVMLIALITSSSSPSSVPNAMMRSFLLADGQSLAAKRIGESDLVVGRARAPVTK